jgi:FAD/FMN-containing dehydrogenase/Fe-S oxidoreductase
MNEYTQRATLESAACEVRFDDVARQLYATDASIYQVEPMGVAFPQGAEQAQEIMRLAGEAEVALIPRGAGTGLAGGALGRGLIVDFSRRNRHITNFNEEDRTVTVDPGVVLDQLNGFLKPSGLCFGPDVATSSRATLGGMIANNSSGSHVPVYGTTSEHVRSIDILLADGRVERVGAGQGTLAELRAAIDALVMPAASVIAEQTPETLMKRWHGYALGDYSRRIGDLSQLIGGSEGTLAAIVSAQLNLVPLPKRKGLALFFFNSVAEAMEASVALLDLKPAAIEHIDRFLLDQTRGQMAFKEARSLLRLDEEPCESIMLVEFYDEVDDPLAILEQRSLGTRKLILSDPAAMGHVWALRKAGLSLLTGCKGAAKPVSGIEDVAVPPERLPEYVRALHGIMKPLGLEGSFYGHAASGLLHVRPVLDLHKGEDIQKFRTLSDEIVPIVKEFKGSLAAEHGVGMARTEYLPDLEGPQLMDIMHQIKGVFDPLNRMNPGKIVGNGEYRFDTNLRWGAGHEIPMPFEPVLAFAAKDGSFIGNLEQCNGCGGCRKAPPTMCPTYLATGEEIMSTRGRANVIRAVLEGRVSGNGLNSPALDLALSNCLSCKACTTECPSNVNMALLKAELKHAQHKMNGVPFFERVMGSIDQISRLASLTPGIVNASFRWRWCRMILSKVLGISPDRPLPPYARQRFDRWFAKRPPSAPAPRGKVILWDDTFLRHHDPHIGKAAVEVLEAAGYEVTLAQGRQCCGRPAFSLGLLDRARRMASHNLALLSDGDEPIIFLDPSCYSMFVEDYHELNLDHAQAVSKRCTLFEPFINDLLDSDPDALSFAEGYNWVAIHGHCHAKALTDLSSHEKLAGRLPNSKVQMLNTGCCGMAGAFGVKGDKAQLSVQVAQPLVEQVQALQAGTHVVASGTSCRHQIDHLTDTRAIHMAELIAENLLRR